MSKKLDVSNEIVLLTVSIRYYISELSIAVMRISVFPINGIRNASASVGSICVNEVITILNVMKSFHEKFPIGFND